MLEGHASIVNSTQFSPDGMRILTTSQDGTARLWDAETGQELGLLAGHSGYLTSAHFSPDGMRIVTASGDGTARLWNVLPVTIDQSGGVPAFELQPPLSEALLDHAETFYPGTLSCERRAQILKDQTC